MKAVARDQSKPPKSYPVKKMVPLAQSERQIAREQEGASEVACKQSNLNFVGALCRPSNRRTSQGQVLLKTNPLLLRRCDQLGIELREKSLVVVEVLCSQVVQLGFGEFELFNLVLVPNKRPLIISVVDEVPIFVATCVVLSH